jgi:hypothetical protein
MGKERKVDCHGLRYRDTGFIERNFENPIDGIGEVACDVITGSEIVSDRCDSPALPNLDLRHRQSTKC